MKCLLIVLALTVNRLLAQDTEPEVTYIPMIWTYYSNRYSATVSSHKLDVATNYTDLSGHGCEWYEGQNDVRACGQLDSEDFRASETCVYCNSAIGTEYLRHCHDAWGDDSGYKCGQITSGWSTCDDYETAKDECCACGGGDNWFKDPFPKDKYDRYNGDLYAEEKLACFDVDWFGDQLSYMPEQERCTWYATNSTTKE